MDIFYSLDEYGIVPSSRQIRAMLHMLSKCKYHESGDRWRESLALLRAAQDNEIPVTEVSYKTGEVQR